MFTRILSVIGHRQMAADVINLREGERRLYANSPMHEICCYSFGALDHRCLLICYACDSSYKGTCSSAVISC